MKKLLCMWMVVCGLLLIPGNMKGQSLKDILNSSAVKNAVTSVTGGKAVTFENLQGTWMYVNPALQLEGDKTVTLRYTVGNKKLTVSTLTAHVVLSGNELTLLFNADKLLKFLSTVSSISSNTTLKAINKLASEYDGMMLGFDLKK